MSTPNEPQDPYGTGSQPEGGVPPVPADPRYPAAPPYGEPSGATGYPAAPQYGNPPAQYGYPAAPQYGSAPYPAAPGYAGGYAYPKNSLAVWSLVLAILGMIMCGFLTGIPAVIIGNNAKRAVASGEANNGGLATAGTVVGWIAIGLSVFGLIAVVLLIAGAGGFTEFVNTYNTSPR
ncbi:MAG: DUF4190 domain-containing protein [Cellulomonas sp.]